MRIVLILISFIISINSFAQNTFKAIVKDHETGDNLPGVTVKVVGTNIGAVSDSSGNVFLSGIPNGEKKIMFTHIGYEEIERTYTFPLKQPESVFEIVLEHGHLQTEEIIISTTRLSRDIEDIPTRVETISREEIEEKINMEPANVVMLLSESTGIQTQQTSATSGNSNIKIQGLDGRYTQILKDGFPLYSGFSEGLSIMQIPPLDLRQVEVIKGPSSTLYGGGAIAGVINFISFEPEEKPLLSALINFESFGEFDLGIFYTGRKNKLGFSLLATGNYKNGYDVDKDDFTEIPRTKALNIAPKLYFYPNPKTIVKLGLSASYEDRLGGDIVLIRNGADTWHTYFEKNISGRFNLTFDFERLYSKENRLQIKSNAGLFSRKIEHPGYTFEGKQYSTYSELSYLLNPAGHHLIGGLNFISDNFREKEVQTITLRDYDHYTTGAFLQDTWDISKKLGLESGLRFDYQNKYGSFLLPRVTVFTRPAENFAMRLTGGLGYEIPTVFNEESERAGLENIVPIDGSLKAETSRGASLDFNYKTVLFDELSFSVNQLFFYTQIKDPLELNYDSALSAYKYTNSDGNLNTKGFETNLRFVYEPFKLFAGYTFTDARLEDNGVNKSLPLTPKHSIGLVLMYEKHGDMRIGYEAYYTGPQYLFDGSKTPPYWVMGVMGQKTIGAFTFFLNFENFTDTRQSRYGPVVYSNHLTPLFREIWTHTEGFYVNGGVKIKL